MKSVELPFGGSCERFRVPDDSVVLEHSFVPGVVDEKGRIRDSLRNPIQSPRLRKLAKASDTIAIVISDITRPTPNHKILPVIIEELNHVSLSNIVIINGTGTHRENTPDELERMLGKEIIDNVEVINHNAFVPEEHAYLGTYDGETAVYLNKRYCEADVKIVTGFIEPHFFAGFSGGPKGIMPGIAGIETIHAFHDPALIAHPDSTWGVVESNPIQRMASGIAHTRKPDFLLNVTLNSKKEITNVFAGEMTAAHREGMDYVKKHSMIPCEEAFDIVITSNSGYPLDQNLYQAVKGMSAARQIVKRGGSIVCVAECEEGIPEYGHFKEILQMRESPEETLRMIGDPEFSMPDQWQAQKLALIQSWADIYLYSTLPEESVTRLNLKPVGSLEKGVIDLVSRCKKQPRIAVIPQGPLSIPYIAR